VGKLLTVFSGPLERSCAIQAVQHHCKDCGLALVAFTVELLMPQTLLLLLPLPCAFLQQRKNIEGSLFLIKRRTQPRFQMLVLNKLSTGAVVCTTAAVSSIWPTRTAWGVLSNGLVASPT
jgi:hypothetical protein